MTASKPLVAVIVDNPQRDLAGLLRVAYEICQRDIEVDLIPMYRQAYDLFDRRYDLVIVNYLRINLVPFLKFLSRRSTKIVVLDTEGSPGRCMERFARSVSDCGVNHLVDHYCLWGNDQLRNFLEFSGFPSEKLSVTGCPRYDMVRSEKVVDKSGNVLLITTAFPIPNPKFSRGAHEELEELIAVGISDQDAHEMVNQYKVAFREMIAVIRRVVDEFKDYEVIIRPHPFEDEAVYLGSVSQGVRVERAGSSIDAIERAKVVLHFNCITGIEAQLLGKPNCSPGWIPKDVIEKLGPPGPVGFVASDLGELLVWIRSVMKGEQKANHDRAPWLEDRFYLQDGRASMRVSEVVQKCLKDSNGPKETLLDTMLESFGFSVKHLGRLWFGFRFMQLLAGLFNDDLRAVKIKHKGFGLAEVHTLLERFVDKDTQASNRLTAYLVKPNTRRGSGEVIRVQQCEV